MFPFSVKPYRMSIAINLVLVVIFVINPLPVNMDNCVIIVLYCVMILDLGEEKHMDINQWFSTWGR